MSSHDDLHKLNVAVFGMTPDHSDGLVGIVGNHSRTLYGTEEDPGGIAKDVKIAKRWIGMCLGVMSVCGGLLVVMEFFAKILPILKEVAQ